MYKTKQENPGRGADQKNTVLVRVFTAVKRHHDHSSSYKGKYLIGAGLQFRGLIHYHHDKKHGNMQADMVLER